MDQFSDGKSDNMDGNGDINMNGFEMAAALDEVMHKLCSKMESYMETIKSPSPLSRSLGSRLNSAATLPPRRPLLRGNMSRHHVNIGITFTAYCFWLAPLADTQTPLRSDYVSNMTAMQCYLRRFVLPILHSHPQSQQRIIHLYFFWLCLQYLQTSSKVSKLLGAIFTHNFPLCQFFLKKTTHFNTVINIYLHTYILNRKL